MRAIVLSHDRQVGLAALVVHRYAALWPRHPLAFVVPDNGGAAAIDGCARVRCARGISATVEALLDGAGDDEWVFWAIDDRFPAAVDAAALRAVHDAIVEGRAAGGFASVKLLRWHEPVGGEPFDIGGVAFAEQHGSRRWGYWHHQFVRAGVLRHVLCDPALGDDAGVDDVQARLFAVEDDEALGRAAVPARDLVRLEEPLVDGRLTANGFDALVAAALPAPAVDHTDLRVEYGTYRSR